MSENRIEKRPAALSEAIRRNRAKQVLPQWLSALKKSVSPDITEKDFVEVKTTAELKAAFYARVKKDEHLLHMEWSYGERRDMVDFMKRTGLRLGSMKAVLFSSKDDLLGAALVPAATVLSKIEEVWPLLEEDFSLTTPDLKHGLCLEFNYYDGQGKYVKEGTYSLTTWGLLSGEWLGS